MREYGTIAVNFWTEGKGRELRGDLLAMALAPYVFACPHGNMLGLFYLPIAYVANDLDIPPEGARKGLRRLSEVDILTLDEASDGIFVHGAARRNLGGSLKPKDNRVKNVRELLSSLRKHPFYRDFLDRYAVSLSVGDLLGEGASEGAPEGPSKPVTVTVTGTGTGTGTGAGGAPGPATPTEGWARLWLVWLDVAFGGLPGGDRLGSRRRLLSAYSTCFARDVEAPELLFRQAAERFVADCKTRGKRPQLQWLCTDLGEWLQEPEGPAVRNGPSQVSTAQEFEDDRKLEPDWARDEASA